MIIDPGMPHKVLQWAQDHGGVHNDCFTAGDPCDQCKATIMASFDHFYGHAADIGEVLSLVFEDFKLDMIADEQGEPQGV